jgi:hypothetical protein
VSRLLLAAALGMLLGAALDTSAAPRAAPPFPSARPERWIGEPQSWGRLRGKVVLLDVWTFG